MPPHALSTPTFHLFPRYSGSPLSPSVLCHTSVPWPKLGVPPSHGFAHSPLPAWLCGLSSSGPSSGSLCSRTFSGAPALDRHPSSGSVIIRAKHSFCLCGRDPPTCAFLPNQWAAPSRTASLNNHCVCSTRPGRCRPGTGRTGGGRGLLSSQAETSCPWWRSLSALKAPQAQGETIHKSAFAHVITEVTQNPSDECPTGGSQEKGTQCPRHGSGMSL